MNAFILGIRTPVRTTAIPVSAKMASNRSGNFPVPVPDQEPCPASGVLKVHRQDPCGLGNPESGRVRCGTQDANPAGAMLDRRQHVHARSAQRDRFEKVARQQGVGLENSVSSRELRLRTLADVLRHTGNTLALAQGCGPAKVDLYELGGGAVPSAVEGDREAVRRETRGHGRAHTSGLAGDERTPSGQGVPPRIDRPTYRGGPEVSSPG